MLPRASMLRIKKLFCNGRVLFVTALSALFLCGCGEPGPKALLQGDRLLQKGQPVEALKRLKVATDLLPRNAQAWNRLGLAYHANHQPDEAFQAYKKALQLDYKLADPHFNLGCLLIEQNKWAEAVDELVIFTSVNPKYLDGWLKLGTAQLRTRRLDAAEKSFKTALTLQPRNPEALNNAGIVALERKRPQDAQAAFSAALTVQANYAPAMLNAAILAQQLNNRTLALNKYRDYLRITPRPSNWDAVNSLAQQLETELTQVARVVPPVLKTNPSSAATNLAPSVTQKNISPGTAASLPPRAAPASPTNAMKTATGSNTSS